MAHEHHHDHGELHYRGARVDSPTLDLLRKARPELARNLELCARVAELSTEEKAELLITQTQIEQSASWVPGYHSAGDSCVTCGQPTRALFADTFDEGELPYAAFFGGLPVHPTDACLAGAPRGLPPNKLDQVRRKIMKDLGRPNPGMTQFFRHDVLSHPPFGLEDWANTVAEENKNKLDRGTVRDMDRLLNWVHKAMFHER